jgi:hypothetical protein
VPSVLVAHELADAQSFADRMAVLDQGEILQVGEPDQVVLRPCSARVAELVGYLGFAPVPGRPGVLAGVHPERIAAGAAPERGLVLTGRVAGSRPAGAAWEADLLLPDSGQDGALSQQAVRGRDGRPGLAATVTCRLADRPGADGDTMTVTVLDPPCFSQDGIAVDGHVREGSRP